MTMRSSMAAPRPVAVPWSALRQVSANRARSDYETYRASRASAREPIRGACANAHMDKSPIVQGFPDGFHRIIGVGLGTVRASRSAVCFGRSFGKFPHRGRRTLDQLAGTTYAQLGRFLLEEIERIGDRLRRFLRRLMQAVAIVAIVLNFGALTIAISAVARQAVTRFSRS